MKGFSAFLDTKRRQWHPTRVLLPGKSRGQRSLEGCSPLGCWGSDTTEQLHFHFSLSCIGEGNGNPLDCSCLENPRDGGAWWAVVYGVTQSRARLKWLSSSSRYQEMKRLRSWNQFLKISKDMFHKIPWRTECLTSPGIPSGVLRSTATATQDSVSTEADGKCPYCSGAGNTLGKCQFVVDNLSTWRNSLCG